MNRAVLVALVASFALAHASYMGERIGMGKRFMTYDDPLMWNRNAEMVKSKYDYMDFDTMGSMSVKGKLFTDREMVYETIDMDLLKELTAMMERMMYEFKQIGFMDMGKITQFTEQMIEKILQRILLTEQEQMMRVLQESEKMPITVDDVIKRRMIDDLKAIMEMLKTKMLERMDTLKDTLKMTMMAELMMFSTMKYEPKWEVFMREILELIMEEKMRFTEVILKDYHTEYTRIRYEVLFFQQKLMQYKMFMTMIPEMQAKPMILELQQLMYQQKTELLTKELMIRAIIRSLQQLMMSQEDLMMMMPMKGMMMRV